MSKFELILLVVSIVLCVCSLTLSPLWYARKHNISYVAVLKLIYIEGLFKGFKEDFKGFLPMCKNVAGTLYNGVCVLIEWCKPPRLKHIFTDELDCAFRTVLAEYTFAPMVPDIIYYYDVPSRISISLYAKSVITPEVAQELTWHIQSVFQRYLDASMLNMEYTVIPTVIDNKITLTVFYGEYPEEHPLYSMACRQATYMNIERTCPPLPEHLAVKINGVALGYKFDTWQSSGQVVPVMWDTKRSPHALISGSTGGGKTIYMKILLEQLLEQGAEVCVCDFKNFGDYRAFRGAYAVGDECDTMLKQFCDDFEKARQSGVASNKRRVLIFDEWGSYTAIKTKREFDDLMKMISPLIMLSRAYNYSIFLISQRFNATDNLAGNLKEQFGVKVFLGAEISTQSASMLFPNSEIDKSARLQEYCGYISTPTTDLEIIISPKVDIQALDKRIEKLSSTA